MRWGGEHQSLPHNLATIPQAAYGASCQGHLNAKATDGGRGVCVCFKRTEFRLDSLGQASWSDRMGLGSDAP